jgi:UTP--glucose-1-phosphate uridylyltransferase
MTTQRIVRKAVFPVAGLGTGILPATKAAPKELLTVVDKPLIHYAVEEASAAGIREMILVTSRNKRAIEDHFDKAYELEAVLALQKRYELLAELRKLFPVDVSYACVRQQEHLGLGHALACARTLVGNEPFAVILPDELIDAPRPAIGQLIDTFARTRQSVLAVHRMNGHPDTPHGYVRGVAAGRRLHRVTGVRATLNGDTDVLAMAGRFVFTPEIFDYLAKLEPNADGELDVVDAVSGLLGEQQVLAYEVDGERFDCGAKLGYLAATLHYGLRHPQLGASFAKLVQEEAKAARGLIAPREPSIAAAVIAPRLSGRADGERLGFDPR